MSRLVVRPKTGMIEDVVNGADGDLVPAVAKDTGRTLRWWTGQRHAPDLGANGAKEVSRVRVGLDENLDQVRAAGCTGVSIETVWGRGYTLSTDYKATNHQSQSTNSVSGGTAQPLQEAAQ